MRSLRTAAIVFMMATGIVAASNAARPGWLGFGFTYHVDRQRAQPWLHVRQVAKGSPAEAAGLRAQDIIRQINGRAISFGSERDALHFFANIRPRDVVTFQVIRVGGERTIRITAGDMPDAYYRLWKSNDEVARRAH